MQLPKYDLFVCALKDPNSSVEYMYSPIIMKLFQLFHLRLATLGFSNLTLDTHQHVPSAVLEQSELALLRDNPFFLSEHYITKMYQLTPDDPTSGRYNPPYRIRPSTDAYTYANHGKRPKFHVMFIGGVYSGKSYLYHEFKLMLTELNVPIEIIDCDNDVPQYADWCKHLHTPEMEHYRDYVKGLNICIGAGPMYRVDCSDVVQHNTTI